MSTRGIIAVRAGDVYLVRYNHSDSYLTGLGKEIVQEVYRLIKRKTLHHLDLWKDLVSGKLQVLDQHYPSKNIVEIERAMKARGSKRLPADYEALMTSSPNDNPSNYRAFYDWTIADLLLKRKWVGSIIEIDELPYYLDPLFHEWVYLVIFMGNYAIVDIAVPIGSLPLTKGYYKDAIYAAVLKVRDQHKKGEINLDFLRPLGAPFLDNEETVRLPHIVLRRYVIDRMPQKVFKAMFNDKTLRKEEEAISKQAKEINREIVEELAKPLF